MTASSSHKPELPPLLPPGLHRLSMEALREICVEQFPSSRTRPLLFDGFCQLRALLVRAAISAEVWLDGSFLTEKIDPDDVDLVMKVQSSVLFSWSDQQRGLLTELVHRSNQQVVYERFRCHCFAFVAYRDGRKTRESYWRDEAFGIAQRSRVPKGIAVVELFDGLSLRLRSHKGGLNRFDLTTIGRSRQLR